MKNTRMVVVFLALLEVFISFLFHQFGSLYFFFDQMSEVAPVRSLVSQGSDEDLMISIGFVLFLILGAFNIARVKCEFSAVDRIFLLTVLLVQYVFLALIEVASFSISLHQSHGWILMVWLLNYAFLWAAFFLSLISNKG